MLISNSYLDLNAQAHGKLAVWGVAKVQDLSLVERVLQTEKIGSILDYGCGKGRLGKVMRKVDGVPVQSYDPAIPEFAAEPQPADLVVCTRVLEHVEPECVDAVLAELTGLARKMVVLTVTTHPGQLILDDGKSAHRTVQPFEWWLARLVHCWRIKAIDVTADGFSFVGRAINGVATN